MEICASATSPNDLHWKQSMHWKRFESPNEPVASSSKGLIKIEDFY